MSESQLDGNKPSELSEEALEQESARQEQDDVRGSLKGREKGLRALQEAQQLLEDQLEDANTELDRLQRELDRAIVEKEEADYLRKEAEAARKQLETSIYNIQEGVEESKVTDLRDERMHRSRRVLAISQVTTIPYLKGLATGLAAGVLLSFLVQEVLAVLNH